MKRLNGLGSRPWPDVASPALIEPDDLVAALAQGATGIDTRPEDDYAVGHIPGTIHIPLNRSFLTWAGALVPLTSRVLIVGDEAEMPQTVADLALIGIDDVAGYVSPDAVEPWRHAGHRLEEVPRASVASAATRQSRRAIVLLDVRSQAEWAASHIPGACHIPLAELPARLDELPRDREIVVHCQSGGRSSIAVSVLMAAGFVGVENMVGGMSAWHEAGQSTSANGSGAA
jgi:hydroxyacylglutathione hydrolase